MFEFSINLSDPSKDSFYFPILVGVLTIILLINLIIMIIKENKRIPGQDNNMSMDRTFQNNVTYPSILERKKNSLRSRYLVAYIITRSAMWAKAPYLYTLFMTVHKFTFAEIGDLYLVDAVAALIFGPITGQLADKYGRRKFCHCYNISIVINLLLRMEGSRPLAYLAQVVTGFGAGLICTTFEAWVVSESEKEFGGYKKEAERFRKRLFKDCTIYDNIVAILTSFICAFAYSHWGIYAPFWISIFLTVLASILIWILWDENGSLIAKEKTWIQYKEASKEFKKPEVLCIGLIEGIANACLNIYLFSWTPILKRSTPGGMNVGFIFTCMLLTMISGTKMFQLLIGTLDFDNYMSIAGCVIIQGILMFLTYAINGFLPRLIFLSLFNGVTGFYNPLNSIIKASILIEKYRALLMNLFRVPLNFYVIIVLLTLRLMNPFTVAFIVGVMCIVAFLIGLFLVIYREIYGKIEDKDKVENILPIDIK